MRIFIVFIISIFASPSLAKFNCERQVNDYFSNAQPKLSVTLIRYTGTIPAHSDQPYYMGEIWNDTDEELGVYQVEASFMAKFTYVALVDQNCEVKDLIEVGFED